MDCIATLVAPTGLTAGDISAARDAVVGTAGPVIDGVACDIAFAARERAGEGARAALEAAVPGADVIVQPATAQRRRRLLIADMDSTMITVECIDELADYAGIKPHIAAITERAMRGELDFAAALAERVALLAGLDEQVIATCLAERVRLMPGARTLIGTMKAQGARTVLISGGFTAFTGVVAGLIGFDRQVANILHIAEGKLAGTVQKPIVDSAVKRATLLTERDALGLAAADTLAVGDGANDIPMLEAAGLGIAYHAKPKAAAAADAAVRVGDLTSLLWAQGIPRAEWAEG